LGKEGSFIGSEIGAMFTSEGIWWNQRFSEPQFISLFNPHLALDTQATGVLMACERLLRRIFRCGRLIEGDVTGNIHLHSTHGADATEIPG
jgi:hypothetical protein